MAEQVETVAGYDDHGNAQVFQLAEGDKLPKGFHATPPKGTHPHEREIAAAHAASVPVQTEMPLKHKPTRAQLEELNKDDLVAEAEKLGVDVPSHATKADIVDAIVHSK